MSERRGRSPLSSEELERIRNGGYGVPRSSDDLATPDRSQLFQVTKRTTNLNKMFGIPEESVSADKPVGLRVTEAEIAAPSAESFLESVNSYLDQINPKRVLSGQPALAAAGVSFRDRVGNYHFTVTIEAENDRDFSFSFSIKPELDAQGVLKYQPVCSQLILTQLIAEHLTITK